MTSRLRGGGTVRSLLFAILLLPATLARGAELDYPIAVAVDPAGAIYIADLNSPCIWKAVDGQLSIYFQGQKKFRTPLNRPRCLAIDGEGRLLAGDTATREVYRFNADGQPEPLTAESAGQPGEIGMPMAIAVNAEGTIFVADLELHCVWKVPAAGGTPEKFIEIPAPRGLAFDAAGSLYVVSAEAGSEAPLVRVAPDGTSQTISRGPFDLPHHVVVDPEGNVYVADNYANAIWRISEGGQEKWFKCDPRKGPLIGPVGLAWRGTSLLVADPKIPGLVEITPEKKATKLELKPPAE